MSNNGYMENNKIKILLISPLPSNTSFGGIGSWTKRFIDTLMSKKTFEIKVVNSVPIDKNGKDIARSKNICKKINCNIRVLKKLRKELKKFEPDIIHLNSSCTSFACVRDYLFLRTIYKRHVPSILHCHCNIQDQINGSKIGKHFFAKNVKMASSVITLNSSSYDYVCREANKHSNIHIVPNFIEESFIINDKKINDRISNIVFVGHLVKQKGIEEIISIAEHFSNIHFTLVSGFTEEYQNRSRFPANIEITGKIPLDLVTKKLDESDVFLFPTHSEGFSCALLEAMARGLPIITTHVGANNDMLENKGGIIVDSKSNEQLKNALIKIDNELVRKEMSVWNINKVKSSYIEDIVINNILNIYSDLMTTKGND